MVDIKTASPVDTKNDNDAASELEIPALSETELAFNTSCPSQQYYQRLAQGVVFAASCYIGDTAIVYRKIRNI